MRLIECVPNISEGRRLEVVKQIVSEAAKHDVTILDQDSGADANRTVVTLVGEISAVEAAAFELIKASSRLIDMSEHSGKHPCIGSTDICPFVPLLKTSFNDCDAAAKRVGQKVGEELGIPVFLYGQSALSTERSRPSYYRSGGLKRLRGKMTDKILRPDFGPESPHLKAGALIIGARDLLIAFNINLGCRDVSIARKIAAKMRNLRDSPDNFPKNFHALGWYIEEFDCCQISLNLTNFRVTGLYQMFEFAKKIAWEFNISVTGSEIVGLVPRKALVDCGTQLLAANKQTPSSTEQCIAATVRGLGLSELYEFEKRKQILEDRLEDAGVPGQLLTSGSLYANLTGD